MVDVGAKAETERVAVAEGQVVMRPETLALILSRRRQEGRRARHRPHRRHHGRQAHADLIPLCHPLALTSVSVDIAPDEALPGLVVRAEAQDARARPASRWKR